MTPHKIYDSLVSQLRHYFGEHGFSQAIVALSGGIDSAVVVALAVRALGAENVRVVMLPSRYSSPHSVDDSVDMATRCGIRGDIVEIEPIFQAALSQLEKPLEGIVSGLAHENLQSRIRMLLTMAISNATGALMLNTSNKSEIMVGYGTLYGDTSGAVGVIADLYKRDVYALSRYINEVQGEVIPRNIIDKAPSAELRPDQFDSDSLPPYEVLDAVLFELVDRGLAVDDVVAKGFDRVVVERIYGLWVGSAFKRAQLPPPLRLA